MRCDRAAGPGFRCGSLTKLLVLARIAFWNWSRTPSCWPARSRTELHSRPARSRGYGGGPKARTRLGGRIVEVDRLVVLHVELDEAQRVLGPRLLDVLAVLHDEIIGRQPRLALARQLFLADPFGYSPCGIGDQPEDRRLKLRGRLVGFAVDDLAMVDMLTVAPIIEEGGGGIDVDPRLRRIALKPAEPLHRHGELARPEPGPALSAPIVSFPSTPSGLVPESA